MSTAPAIVQPDTSQRRTASPLVDIADEPAARLFIYPPLPDPLRQGRVFLQYRTENIRIVPVFGKGALAVSPRVGHLHVTVDDGPWHFIETSGETIVVVGLQPGNHRILVELADPVHRVLDYQTIDFRIPAPPSASRQ